MAEEKDTPTDGPNIIRWREYTIQLPPTVVRSLEKALDDQVAYENRNIGLSEFICWLISMGLVYRATLVAEERKKDKRIISPGE